MRNLDGIDYDIIRLLLEDARRPYSEIAEQVDRSPPAVSDRIDRLQDLGVIEGFTVHLDRSALHNAHQTLIHLTPRPDRSGDVFSSLAQLEETEDIFRLSDGSIVINAHLTRTDAIAWLRSGTDLDAIGDLSVQPIVAHDEVPGLRPGGFDLDCVVCGNTVDDDGEITQIGGEVKAFCCESCLARYEERYEAHEAES